MKAGEANYLNVTSGTNGKNRWGDYSGAAVDPTDSTKIWLFGEYAASPAHTWGTWAGEVFVLPAPPNVDFDFSPANPQVSQLVQFTDTSTGSPTVWFWDFGDGTTSTLQNPTHSYSVANTYTVVLTASNSGGSGQIAKDVVVTAEPVQCNHCARVVPFRSPR